MKKIIVATALLTAFVAPAFAQKSQPKPEDPVAAGARRDKEAAERAYENAVKNTATRQQQAPQDPWATVRDPAKK